MLINCLIKEIVLFDDRMEIYFNSPIKKSPGAVKTGLLNASTTALDKMVEHTELYKYNVAKFKKIVNGVETSTVTPDKIARTAYRAVTAKRAKYVYNINRNLALRFLSALPKKTQVWVIRKILTKGKNKKSQ